MRRRGEAREGWTNMQTRNPAVHLLIITIDGWIPEFHVVSIPSLRLLTCLPCWFIIYTLHRLPFIFLFFLVDRQPERRV